MAKFTLNLGRDEQGKPKFNKLSIDLPEDVGKVDAEMNEKGEIELTWEGDGATVRSVLDYLRNNIGYWFPGYNPEA